tara:strand:+ start:2796 stop:3155 length:360 start_codon:yes stop_codon:yes gene_type:complete
MSSVNSAVKERKIGVANYIPLYDSSGQITDKVEGTIMRCEFGTGLGWPKEGIMYSVAFVWKENSRGFRSNGPEHVCVLAQGEQARTTFDGSDFRIQLEQRNIQLQKDKDSVYQVATGRL